VLRVKSFEHPVAKLALEARTLTESAKRRVAGVGRRPFLPAWDWSSIFSRADEVIGWRYCVDPEAHNYAAAPNHAEAKGGEVKHLLLVTVSGVGRDFTSNDARR
jgi:hypothetical protein